MAPGQGECLCNHDCGGRDRASDRHHREHRERGEIREHCDRFDDRDHHRSRDHDAERYRFLISVMPL